MQDIDHPRIKRALKGIIPPLTMPFSETGALETAGLAAQIELMLSSGASGIVVGGSTGEGHTLSFEEHAEAARAAHDALDGRASFLAGLIVNSTQEAIARAQALAGLKVTALQVTPVHYLFKPGRQATIDHFRAITDASGLPVIIYNVIPWNYLDVGSMIEIMEEVPGVVGIKQSAGDLKSVSDLLLSLPDDRIVLSGIDALLYPAFMLGAHGAITALTAAVPRAATALWQAAQSGDHGTALAMHKLLGRLWNALCHDNLPACTKYIQHRQGLPLYHPRAPMERVSDAQKAAIDDVLQPLLEMTSKLTRKA